MDINDSLQELVKQFKNNGMSENRAWLEAYIRLVDAGELTNLYVVTDTKNPKVETFYIFAHSTSDNRDYTYLSANYTYGCGSISINLYDKFYDHVVATIDGNIEDGELKNDMLEGLDSLFTRICEDYVTSIDTRVTELLREHGIGPVRYYDFRAKVLNGIQGLFDEYDVKHLTIDVDNCRGGLRGTFTTKNLNIDSRSICWNIDKFSPNSTISFK